MIDNPLNPQKLVEFGWVKNLTQPDLPERPLPFYNIDGPGLQQPLRAWCRWCDLVPGREDYHFAVTVEWDDFRGKFVWAWWFEYGVWAYQDVNATTQDGDLEYVWAGIETIDPVDPDIHVAGPLTTETNSYRTPSGAWHLWYRDRNEEYASDADRY